MNPLVSVVIPMYKGKDYVLDALHSVTNQTYKNLEIIVINDQSPDGSDEVAKQVAAEDSRVRVIDNKYEKGIVGALNTGLELAKGDLIARMDADDICYLDRIEKQVAFMLQNEDVTVCGGFVEVIGIHSGIKWEYPTDPEICAIYPLLNSPVAHPATMLRKSFFDQHGLKYDYEYQYGEDIDLWQRVLDAGGKLSNIPEVILKYRTHNTNITVEYASRNGDLAQKVRIRILEKLGITPTEEVLNTLIHFAGWTPATKELYRKYLNLVNVILSANMRSKVYNQDKLATFLRTRLHHVTVAGGLFIPWKHLSWGVVDAQRLIKDNIKVTLRKIKALTKRIARKVLG